MSLKVWIDGKLFDKDDAKISVYDHGLLYGDGIFEGIRITAGRVFRLDDHLARFATAARTIGLALPGGTAAARAAVLETARAFGQPEAYARLVCTRGVGALGVDPIPCREPRLFCIVDRIHLYGDRQRNEGLDLVTVPFNGAALAVNSTIGGHTPIAFTALPPAMSNIKDGKLRGLAVLAVARSPALPDVPTNAEAGIPDLESDTLTGIVAPAGTPKDVIERWHDAIVKMVATPEVRQRLEALGFAPVADTPAQFGARIKAEIAKWGKVVHDANIKAD